MKSAFERSIFSRCSITVIMTFCLFLVLSDIWTMYCVLFIREIGETTTWWIVPLCGAIFFWAGWYTKQTNEKLAYYILGISFFLKSLVGKEIVLWTTGICLLLDIYAISNLWICYKKFSQDLEVDKQQRLRQNLKGWGIPLLAVIGFIAAIFFYIWISYTKKSKGT